MVYGADFGYPEGKAYARGTYLYDYFWSDQDRMSPAEARFFAFACGSIAGPARRQVRDGRVMYATPVLDGYRDRFLGLMESINADVIPVPGGGQALPRRGGALRAQEQASAADWPKATDAPESSWREFLSEYARSIELLPAFSPASPEPERELWHTLLPVAARVVKEGQVPGPGALEEARRWSLERVRRVIQEKSIPAYPTNDSPG